MLKKESTHKLPPLHDPYWPTVAEETRQYLCSPRTWKDMEAWRKTAKIGVYLFRNVLAFLEMAGKARPVYLDRRIVWVQTGVIVPRSVPRLSRDDDRDDAPEGAVSDELQDQCM